MPRWTRAGGYLASADEGKRIVDLLWQNGKLNRKIIAKDAPVLADAFGLSDDAADAKFFMVEEDRHRSRPPALRRESSPWC